MKILFTILFSVFLCIGSSAQQFKTEKGKVEFLSKASLSEFTGKSGDLNGLVDLDKNILDFFIDLNTLKTGIGLRDRHMRDNYLETKKFPFAEFSGNILENINLAPGESKNVTARGKFKIHGVERSIEVPGTLKRINDKEINLVANFTVLLSDYKIDVPSVLFYELAEEQIVSINALLKK